MNQQKTRAIIEALLLAAEAPLSVSRIESVLDDASPETIQDALRSLQLEYDGEGRGIHLVRIAGGFQLRTNPAFGDQVRAFFESEPVRLSQAAMETLAIVGYRQPLTRAEVEEVRGVDCSGVLKRLRDFELIDIVGRLDDIGKPHVYGTTDRFLEFFGLEDLSELPTLDESELQALVEMHEEAHPDAEETADDESPDEADPRNEPPATE